MVYILLPGRAAPTGAALPGLIFPAGRVRQPVMEAPSSRPRGRPVFAYP